MATVDETKTREAEAAKAAEAAKVSRPKEYDPKDILTVSLRNPTRARRIIHDGITVMNGNGSTSQKQITIDPGATLKSATIHRLIADELRQRNKVKKDSDLIVGPVTTDDDEDDDEKAA